LYVVEQGARIEKEYRRLLVVKQDEVLLAVPAANVDGVVLVGNVGVTTPAMQALLEAGVRLWLVDRLGRMRGQLVPASGRNIPLRHSQYRCATDPEFCLRIARSIAGGKLRNCRTMARRISRSHAVDARLFARMTLAIGRVATATSLAELRGAEGEGARCYFAALRGALRDEMSFERRTRRPPRDPANALLSLGYTLLTQDLISACEIVGLDSYDGFYHSDKYGRPALALDLVEEFRSVIVDSVVLNLVNRRRLTNRDFEAEADGGIMLNRKGLRTFFRAYAARLNTSIQVPGVDHPLTYQKLFEVQARKLRKVIEGSEESYAPYLTR
jgi:CRISPR-associated protein Cas1